MQEEERTDGIEARYSIYKFAALCAVADAARDVWAYVICCQGWDDCVKVLGDALNALDGKGDGNG